MRPSTRIVRSHLRRTSALLSAALLGACSMAPKYVQPDSPVPQTWPDGEAYRDTVSAEPHPLTYAEVFEDPALQELIAQALENNRNLRVAAANIAAARAQVKVTRANQFPALATTASATHQETGGGFGLNGWSYALRGGVSNFELDLFGRLKNATAAQVNTALSTEAAARTVQLGLVADIAQGWATYAADRELLRIAEDTARIAGESVRLTQARLEGGIAARSELRQAQQVLETARSDLAAQKTALAQDVNALRLLVGADFDESALPGSITRVNAALAEVPASADTTILLSRPDVLEAEYSLRAANANIGVARAQLFPTISLSALTGFAAQSLSGLFDEASRSTSYGGNGEWSIFTRAAAAPMSALPRPSATPRLQPTKVRSRPPFARPPTRSPTRGPSPSGWMRPPTSPKSPPTTRASSRSPTGRAWPVRWRTLMPSAASMPRGRPKWACDLPARSTASRSTACSAASG